MNTLLKHFALNDCETDRQGLGVWLGEQAAREIYLKAFQKSFEEASANGVMAAYTRWGAVWSGGNAALIRGILREEWGYAGNIMTDWWMRSSKSPEFPEIKDQAYRVRAGVNVLMPGGSRTGKKVPDGTLLESLGKEGGITTGEMQKNAAEILGMIISLQNLRK